MTIGRCGVCGQEDTLLTAPGGGLLCHNCLDVVKLINLARLKGWSDAEVSTMIREAVQDARRARGEAPYGTGGLCTKSRFPK